MIGEAAGTAAAARPARIAAGEAADRARPPGEIAYRAAWRATGLASGAHASRREGSGGAFRDVVPLMRHPDPRRLDLLRSVRDPYGDLHVRRPEHRAALTLHMLVDGSASMGFSGVAAKPALVSALGQCLAASATRIGDAFSLAVCGDAVDAERSLPASRRRGLAAEVAVRLAGPWPRGASARGLLEAAARLPRRRGFVFLVSDFRLPLGAIEAVLVALSGHDIVPVDVSDPVEAEALPAWGLVELADLETGRHRLVVMRPRFRDAWITAATARRAAVDRLCRRFGRAPFRLAGRFDAEALQRHLYGGGG